MLLFSLLCNEAFSVNLDSLSVQRRQPVSMGPSAGNGSRSGVRETMAVPVSDTGTQESSNIGETVSALTRDDSDLDIVNIIEPSENKISILQKAILVSVGCIF